MASVVNRQVNVYINSGEAAKAYDRLIAREKLLNAELAKTTDPKRIKQLAAEIDKLKDPIDRAAKKMKGELTPSMRELETATRKFLNEWKKTGDPESLRNFQLFKAELDKTKAQIHGLDAANNTLTKKGIFTGAFWANLAAGGITAATAALGSFFRGAVEEALDADAATKRLQGTLDNLGESDVFDRLTRKAQAVADKFKYLDNDDVVGVFNKLIDYGRLTEKQMDQLLPIIVNFAAKSRISIDESASVIIKALEGNGKALKEYGIRLKDSGDETERFNIITTTLAEKVDGAAESFQNSADGGIAAARQQMANLKEEIGSGLIPILLQLLKVANMVIKPLSYIFGGKKLTSDFVKAIEQNPETIQQSQADLKIIEGQFSDFIATAKKQNKDIDAVTTEFINNLKKRKEALDAQIPKKSTQAVFSGNKAQEKFTLASDAVSQSLAIQQFLDSQATKTTPLGISQNDTDGDKSVVKKIKKDADDAIKSIKDLGDTIEKLRVLMDQSIQKSTQGTATGDKAFGSTADFAKKMMDDFDRITERVNRNTLAGLELNMITKSGKDRLDAELLLLEKEQQVALENKTLTEQEKLLIEEQFRQKRVEAENSYNQKLIAKVGEYAQQVLSIYNILSDAHTQRENAELQREQLVNDRKQRILERRLKSGVVTHLQYEREMQRMEQERQKRENEIAKKQFYRQQRADIIQAVINGALSITSTLAAKPGPVDIATFSVLRAINVGLAIATTAAQIATIAGQKPPTFAEGGKLGGRSHAAGGNAVIDGSGRKIAEVEAGEGIVNKRTMADRNRYSLSGTPGQIISSLNGMYGVSWEKGATLIPAWRDFRPQRMNYAAMKNVYAAGGVFTEKNQIEASQNSIFENFSGVISDMQSTIDRLTGVLANGIVSYSLITQQEKQQARLDAIRNDATMKG